MHLRTVHGLVFASVPGFPYGPGRAVHYGCSTMERYKAGSHTLRLVATRELVDRRRGHHRGTIAKNPGTQWAVSVDRIPVASLFASKPEAWTAGVTEADRLDHLAVQDPDA